MPGHRILDKDATLLEIEKIVKLVESHDILFLLTDSRESRWLPSVLGSAYDKIVITIALGFDSYVAMRHGAKNQEPRLGCYFCHDIHAPSDTLSNRSLDQQCTVTRPGISYLASATGVELLASILQHPLGSAAPSVTSLSAMDQLAEDASILGAIPHQVRGYLSHFQNMQLVGEAFRHCTACSPPIQKAFCDGGIDFIMASLTDPNHTVTVSGAQALQVESLTNATPVEETDEFCLI
jgi:ubiquitin-like modifier-activating enzyme ATG7